MTTIQRYARGCSYHFLLWVRIKLSFCVQASSWLTLPHFEVASFFNFKPAVQFYRTDTEWGSFCVPVALVKSVTVAAPVLASLPSQTARFCLRNNAHKNRKILHFSGSGFFGGTEVSDKIEYFRISHLLKSTLTLDILFGTRVCVPLFYDTRDLYVTGGVPVFESSSFCIAPATWYPSAKVYLHVCHLIAATSATFYLQYVARISLLTGVPSILLYEWSLSAVNSDAESGSVLGGFPDDFWNTISAIVSPKILFDFAHTTVN